MHRARHTRKKIFEHDYNLEKMLRNSRPRSLTFPHSHLLHHSLSLPQLLQQKFNPIRQKLMRDLDEGICSIFASLCY